MNVNARTAGLATLVGALALALPLGAQAQEAAPPGEAEAVAAEVQGVAAVGETHAQADGESGEATGNAVAVGGEPLGEATGGTQRGPGSSKGAILDTEETELGRLAVAPWEATVEQSEEERRANARAALARLILLQPDVLEVNVLESESTATHTSAQSTGEGESNGATVTLGGEDGLSVILLHSETSSQAGGSSYIASINDNQIITSDDADGNCTLEIPGLLGLTCLSASGGEGDLGDGTGVGDGAQEAAASVAEVTLGDGEDGGLAATVVGGEATAGSGGGEQVESAGFAPPDDGGTAAAAPRGDLPRTGSSTKAGLTALALLSLGAVMLALRQQLPSVLNR